MAIQTFVIAVPELTRLIGACDFKRTLVQIEHACHAVVQRLRPASTLASRTQVALNGAGYGEIRGAKVHLQFEAKDGPFIPEVDIEAGDVELNHYELPHFRMDCRFQGIAGGEFMSFSIALSVYESEPVLTHEFGAADAERVASAFRDGFDASE